MIYDMDWPVWFLAFITGSIKVICNLPIWSKISSFLSYGHKARL